MKIERIITDICGYQENCYILENNNDVLIIWESDYNENKHCSFMEYGISYSSDLDKAVKLAKEELKKLYKDANYDINVKVIRWDSSAVILRCYVWGKDISESFENSCKLNENLKKVFDKNNIEIPYNYINVINKK